MVSACLAWEALGSTTTKERKACPASAEQQAASLLNKGVMWLGDPLAFTHRQQLAWTGAGRTISLEVGGLSSDCSFLTVVMECALTPLTEPTHLLISCQYTQLMELGLIKLASQLRRGSLSGLFGSIVPLPRHRLPPHPHPSVAI